MLSRIVTVGLALGLLLPILLGADNKTQDIALDGKWEGTSFTSDGENTPESFVILLIEKDKVTITEGTRITIVVNNDQKEHKVEDSGTLKGGIKVDLTSSPKAIDFTWSEGDDKVETVKGIYEIKGNVMRLCLSGGDGKARPTEFSSKKGSGWTMGTLIKK